MDLIFKLVITLIILVIPFIIYLKNTNKEGKMPLIFSCIIYLIIASPVIIAVINHKIVQYEDANIGLGLSFLTTWFLTICAFLVSLYLLIKKRVNNAPR
ncbi:hypothetical protein DCE79_06960 [Lysinibacillus sp. 2017]|uniref:hypothetical protein n=1 Tax=unclassified Lysinibacillus TaxID=2636778 RepID=UPI000D5288EB|nr:MULTISPECIES: hypothetical protein [unclassified Lysinibacillus]AWE07161.1 hypothetical protein DCE79_06960 [Lysinibacillus sp. 2017]TGN36919.1 hypothetical protein E4L99_00055 [Lysinibacillus sp. S2017]